MEALFFIRHPAGRRCHGDLCGRLPRNEAWKGVGPDGQNMDQRCETFRAIRLQLCRKSNRPEYLFGLCPSRACFVIIDMQNFSCAPPVGEALPCIDEVIAQINRLADFCRTVHVPVIWVRHNLTVDGSSYDAGLYPAFHERSHWENVCNRSKGTEISPEMHFNPFVDHMVFKNRYSAFLSNPPELRDKLEALKRRQLIVAGVAANVCVESTVRDAMQLDYEVVLVSDGITASDETLLDSTMKNTLLFFGDVRTTEEVIEALRKDES
jgi:ureidoacrylate peracid hydrolase